MIPRELVSGQSLIVFGLAVVAFIFLMRRTFLRPRGSTERDHPHKPETEVESVQMSAETVIEKLEVRLFDFAREVEGRMQTRIAVLDRLIVDADREILRLQDLLASTKGINGAGLHGRTIAELRPIETPTAGKAPARQPDLIVPPPPPTEGSQREAA